VQGDPSDPLMFHVLVTRSDLDGSCPAGKKTGLIHVLVTL
jgi:hypothetical protein